jgi:hypothetical protein
METASDRIQVGDTVYVPAGGVYTVSGIMDDGTVCATVPGGIWGGTAEGHPIRHHFDRVAFLGRAGDYRRRDEYGHWVKD